LAGIGVARRFADALSRGLLGIALSVDLEDVRLIERELEELGLLGIVERWNYKKIVVFYINIKKIRGACLYEQCSGIPKTGLKACLDECVRAKLDSLREALEKAGVRSGRG